ncbi:hypothetical protein COO60DRAFT_1051060 [Scenedesmus sp. NREL 46B-D3]|nr:hypothetical protein COO60DRAFT_1051060 [Scenedesmus sp. NREL 46B-D3]
MKRKSDDKQRTISSFFASAPGNKPTSKPLARQQQHGEPATAAAAAAAATAAAAGPPHSKRHKPSNDAEVIEVNDADDQAPPAAPPAAAPHTPGSAAYQHADVRAPPAVPDVRNRARHSKAQAKLVGDPGAASLAEPGARGAAGAPVPAGAAAAGGGGSRRQQQLQQQLKYTPLEQQVVALKAAHPGVSLSHSCWVVLPQLAAGFG